VYILIIRSGVLSVILFGAQEMKRIGVNKEIAIISKKAPPLKHD